MATAAQLASRRRMAVVRAWAGALGTLLSALLFLADFATNMLALRTYYRYQFQCPHAPPSSPLLRHDPVCRAIRFGRLLYDSRFIFWMELLLLLLAHLTYAIVFYWFSHHPPRHSLRFAFFLPLIHLYRLLNLLLHSRSAQRLNELQKSQRALNSLYNALGVAVQSTPQVVLQLYVALSLGVYAKGSTDPNLQAQAIPTILMLSIISSLASGTYNASMAMYFHMDDHIPLFKRACISVLFGIEIFIAMIEKGVCITAVMQHSTPDLVTSPFIIYMSIETIVAWVFSCFIVRVSSRHDRHKSIWAKATQSLGLAFMMRTIGPTYVLMKLRKGIGFFLWGSFLHVLGKLTCPALVRLWPIGIEPPCYNTSHSNGMEAIANKYLTCGAFMGITFPSYFVFLVVHSIIIWLHRDNIESYTFKVPFRKNRSLLTPKCNGLPRSPSDASTKVQQQQLSVSTRFTHFICILVVLLVHKAQRNHALKGKPCMLHMVS